MAESRSTLGTSVALVDQHYDLSAGADITDNQQDDLTYRALFTGGTQLAGNKEGWATGRSTGRTAGVIVAVDGEPAGEQFDILVNGSRQAVGTIGSRQFVGLQPFKTHDIRLVPRSIAFNGFDSGIEPATLYPGNVHRVELVSENRYLLITNIIDDSEQVLRNVVLNNGEERYLILEDGVVQIEVRPFDQLDIDLGDGEQCSVTAPDPQGEDIFILDAPLICLD